MTSVFLDLPQRIKEDLWKHLLPRKFISEEAAFLYVNGKKHSDEFSFNLLEWHPVLASEFYSRSALHFELTDETRAKVIKRAHDLGASLFEFHSHSGHWPAAFSGSDMLGFEEFVPHVWWRLQGRPYGAIVVTRSGFDGLIWIQSPKEAIRLNGIRVSGRVLKSTGLSLLQQEHYG